MGAEGGDSCTSTGCLHSGGLLVVDGPDPVPCPDRGRGCSTLFQIGLVRYAWPQELWVVDLFFVKVPAGSREHCCFY